MSTTPSRRAATPTRIAPHNSTPPPRGSVGSMSAQQQQQHPQHQVTTSESTTVTRRTTSDPQLTTRGATNGAHVPAPQPDAFRDSHRNSLAVLQQIHVEMASLSSNCAWSKHRRGSDAAIMSALATDPEAAVAAIDDLVEAARRIGQDAETFVVIMDDARAQYTTAPPATRSSGVSATTSSRQQAVPTKASTTTTTTVGMTKDHLQSGGSGGSAAAHAPSSSAPPGSPLGVDSLQTIADRYSLTVEELRYRNPHLSVFAARDLLPKSTVVYLRSRMPEDPPTSDTDAGGAVVDGVTHATQHHHRSNKLPASATAPVTSTQQQHSAHRASPRRRADSPRGGAAPSAIRRADESSFDSTSDAVYYVPSPSRHESAGGSRGAAAATGSNSGWRTGSLGQKYVESDVEETHHQHATTGRRGAQQQQKQPHTAPTAFDDQPPAAASRGRRTTSKSEGAAAPSRVGVDSSRTTTYRTQRHHHRGGTDEDSDNTAAAFRQHPVASSREAAQQQQSHRYSDDGDGTLSLRRQQHNVVYDDRDHPPRGAHSTSTTLHRRHSSRRDFVDDVEVASSRTTDDPSFPDGVAFDTLRSVAQRFGVSVVALANTNEDIVSYYDVDDPLPAGLDLVIPTQRWVETTPSEPGDTLLKIAEDFGVVVEDLADLNPDVCAAVRGDIINGIIKDVGTPIVLPRETTAAIPLASGSNEVTGHHPSPRTAGRTVGGGASPGRRRREHGHAEEDTTSGFHDGRRAAASSPPRAAAADHRRSHSTVRVVATPVARSLAAIASDHDVAFSELAALNRDRPLKVPVGNSGGESSYDLVHFDDVDPEDILPPGTVLRVPRVA